MYSLDIIVKTNREYAEKHEKACSDGILEWTTTPSSKQLKQTTQTNKLAKAYKTKAFVDWRRKQHNIPLQKALAVLEKLFPTPDSQQNEIKTIQIEPVSRHHKRLLKTLAKLYKALNFLTQKQLQILTPFQEDLLYFFIENNWDGESEITIKKIYSIVMSRSADTRFTSRNKHNYRGGI